MRYMAGRRAEPKEIEADLLLSHRAGRPAEINDEGGAGKDSGDKTIAQKATVNHGQCP